MKILGFAFTIFSAFCLNAETLTCTGVTNDPHTTNLNFEIQIQGKPDKDFPSQTSYKSRIKTTLPDGSTRLNGIDLSERPRTTLNKIIYGGLTTKLELTYNPDHTLQSAILDSPNGNFHQLPVNCVFQGQLPVTQVCSEDVDKSKSLLAAILSGNIVSVQTAIECGANVNKADKNGCTPIMFAIDSSCGTDGLKYISSFGSPKFVIDSLISSGAFVNVTDKAGDTPLIKAAKLNIRDVYDSFIAAEANFDAQDSKGYTALMYAAYNGDSWVTQGILDGNPDRRIKNKSGQTAFDIAKHWQKDSVIDLVRIPDISIDIAGQPDGSCSPLKIEVKQGQVIEIVLKATESKMFRFESSALSLDLMADVGLTTKQIITADTAGKFSFTCGYHGSNTASKGEITVK